MLHTAIVFLVLVFATSTANGCICAPPVNETYADLLCRNSMVVRAVVLKRQTASGQSGATGLRPPSGVAEYPIRVIDVFRNTNNLTIPSVVVTNADTGMCGQYFPDQETEYLILGYTQGNSSKFRTDICQQSARWSSLAPNAVEGLQSGRYARGCKNNP